MFVFLEKFPSGKAISAVSVLGEICSLFAGVNEQTRRVDTISDKFNFKIFI